jgi:hypothetical protein
LSFGLCKLVLKKAFCETYFLFLDQPLKALVFSETVWTHIGCRDVHADLFFGIFLQLKICFLGGGNICTRREPNWFFGGQVQLWLHTKRYQLYTQDIPYDLHIKETRKTHKRLLRGLPWGVKS